MGAIFEKIRMLHIESTTRCNAGCPACGRSILGERNPHFAANIDLDTRALSKFLESDLTQETEKFILCGNYGDPVAAGNILEILDLLREANKNSKTLIHTNGGLRDPNWWAGLAKKKIAVYFALDGLADTHSIYRRNVSWEKVMENADAFISAGGRAIWKFIRFEHNKHQVDLAKKMASERGFKDFILRDDYLGRKVDYNNLDNDSERLRSKNSEPSFIQFVNANREEAKSYDMTSIACEAKEKANIFLDAQGRLWPCCWLGQLDQTGRTNEREFFKKAVLAKYEENFNSLLHHSVAEIIQHSWMGSSLEESWRRPADDLENPALLSCARNCADKKC